MTDKSTARAIPVVYAVNEKYAPYLSASLESLAANLAEGRTLGVTVLHSGLSESTVRAICASAVEGRMRVCCFDATELIGHLHDRMYAPSYLSAEMYYRALIPELFPECERVIYLDCDLVVLRDVGELYRTDMAGRAMLGARNPMHPKMRAYVEGLGVAAENYINSGVLLMNCRRLRELDFTKRFFAALSERKELRFPDQDLINLLLEGEIGFIDARWNYLWHIERLGGASDPSLRMEAAELRAYSALMSDAAILHYSGDMKPWVNDALRGADEFFRYAERCPMRAEIKAARARALIGQERIKLLFAERDGGELVITAAHLLPRGCRGRELSVSLSGQERTPEVIYERECTVRAVRAVQRIFTVRLPLGVAAEAVFRLGGADVLFEYERYFPLNGYPQSYFVLGGSAVYREGRRLLLRPCSLGTRLGLEARYIAALARGGLGGLKCAAVRLGYPILRRIMPRRAWLISDRPDAAGDNGEALFRYLSSQAGSGISPIFVVRRSCPDYKRLRRLGKVAAAGSLRHKLLSLTAEVKAGSHTDAEVYDPIDGRCYKDILARQLRVFLQHGITKDDISSAYSRYAQGISLFITAAYPEYFSIVSNPGYGLSPSRVRLTGFPRHDLLEEGRRERLILVCPTWRKHLSPEGGGNIEQFLASAFYAAWHGLLSEGGLPALAGRYGYRTVLLLHKRLEPYSSTFSDLAPAVEVLSSGNYAELISRAALTLTDHSSVAFESAYLGRPVLYYRPDEEEFFASHTCKRGYFDPRSDGFGEVAEREGELLSRAERLLAEDCSRDPGYSERADGFFAYRDKKSSQRVARAIEEAVALLKRE